MPLHYVADFAASAAARSYVEAQLKTCQPAGWAAARSRSNKLEWSLFASATGDPREALGELRDGRGEYFTLQFSIELQQFVVTHSNWSGSPLPPTPERLVQHAVVFSAAGLSDEVSLSSVLTYIMATFKPNVASTPSV